MARALSHSLELLVPTSTHEGLQAWAHAHPEGALHRAEDRLFWRLDFAEACPPEVAAEGLERLVAFVELHHDALKTLGAEIWVLSTHYSDRARTPVIVAPALVSRLAGWGAGLRVEVIESDFEPA